MNVYLVLNVYVLLNDYLLMSVYLLMTVYPVRIVYLVERWGAGVETQKNVRGEIGGWGRVPLMSPTPRR